MAIDHGQRRELQRDRQFLRDQIRNGHARAQRVPRSPCMTISHPQRVLHGQWAVEAILMAQRGDDLRILVFARQRQHRIAGQHLLQPEHDHRHQHSVGTAIGTRLDQDAPHGGHPLTLTPLNRISPSGYGVKR